MGRSRRAPILLAGSAAAATVAAAASRLRGADTNFLEVDRGEWEQAVDEPGHLRWEGRFTVENVSDSREGFILDVAPEVTLLAEGTLEGIASAVWAVPRHEDAPARPDGYWKPYILESGARTRFDVVLEIRGEDLSTLESAWVRVRYITYGPAGRLHEAQHAVLPLRFPPPAADPEPISIEGAEAVPLPTHLLSHRDDPVTVVERYAAPHARPGDVVCLSETPMAIVQGRTRHPESVEPGWLARALCRHFLPTSSLATACGMQTLIDIVGPVRVLGAFIGGTAARLVGVSGGFYRLAGEQARLIDDVTGTLPPYDQFIVLGPQEPQRIVEAVKRRTGIDAAAVDANDLGAVDVLASTAPEHDDLLLRVLERNPAGNSDERTPVTLVRPRASAGAATTAGPVREASRVGERVGG